MLHIYKASAGSGKTYTLTYEYIKLLFENTRNFSKTLAVTFTNNACSEMKDRIIEKLFELAYSPNADYTKKLLRDFPYNAIHPQKGLRDTAAVMSRAQQILRELLHNYSFFFVETIDSFTQKVIRSFAKDLGLPPKFDLVIENDDVLETITQNLLVHSADNIELHKQILEFAFSDVEEHKTTDLRAEIKRESRNFFSEKYQDAYPNISFDEESVQKRIAEIKQFFVDQKTFVDTYIEEVTSLAKKALSMIGDAGLDVINDFRGRTKGKLTCLPQYAKGNIIKLFDVPSSDIDSLVLKVTPAHRALFATEFPCVIQKIQDIASKTSQRHKEFVTAQKLLEHRQGIILSFYIQAEIDRYCRDENSFLISYANMFLHSIIDNSNTPFVYEKIGQQIEHIMIDEFQDTSKLQWENFKPILMNLLAMGKDALVIGDVKQSIYRFRNGNWRLLHNLQSDPDFRSSVQSHPLDSNYRSLKNIVDFNNAFFRKYADFVEQNYNASSGRSSSILKEIYADCKQEAPRGDGGCVELTIVTGEKKPDTVESILERIFEKVLYLLECGRRPDDIMFLCYTNNQITQLVEFFNEKKKDPRYSHYQRAFSIMSSQALRIANSLAVRFIVSYLTRMTVTAESKASQFLEADMTYLYQQMKNQNEASHETCMIDLTAESIYSSEGISKNMSLFETCESIIAKFALYEFSSEVPFLIDFQNIVYQYSKNNSTSISHFIDYWNDYKNNKYLSQSQAVGCMNASTIHKSKGLAYPVVIIPEFLSTKNNSRSVLYETNLDALKVVSLAGTLKDSSLCEQYLDEELDTEIDFINALYVACTRPKEELYIYGASYGKTRKASTIFSQVIASMPVGEVDEETMTYILGEPVKKESNKQESYDSEDLTYYVQEEQQEMEINSGKLLPDRRSRDFLDIIAAPQDKRLKGLLMHAIMEHVIVEDDIEHCIDMYSPDALSLEERSLLKADLHQKIAHVRQWFDGSWDRVLTEQPLLSPGGEDRRPDRMMFRGKAVTIVDYKFTDDEHASYKKQVREYMDILSQMGYTPEGYIWYVLSDTVVPV